MVLSTQSVKSVIDQMGRRVGVPLLPQRIVSLVPSQTELLFDLGLGQRVVGVTKFCLHPAAARQTAMVIGGTKNFDFAKIVALQPDLIIGNKEENYEQGIEQLATEFPIWMSDISTLAEALDMIRRVGLVAGAKENADVLAAEIEAAFKNLAVAKTPQTAAYFIWRKPYMVAANGTFINDIMARAGFANVFAHMGRYPEITVDELAKAAPARILLSSEPYPFSEKHLSEFQKICPAAQVKIVDGELFSWYGSRLRLSAAYIRQLAAVS